MLTVLYHIAYHSKEVFKSQGFLCKFYKAYFNYFLLDIIKLFFTDL